MSKTKYCLISYIIPGFRWLHTESVRKADLQQVLKELQDNGATIISIEEC